MSRPRQPQEMSPTDFLRITTELQSQQNRDRLTYVTNIQQLCNLVESMIRAWRHLSTTPLINNLTEKEVEGAYNFLVETCILMAGNTIRIDNNIKARIGLPKPPKEPEKLPGESAII